VASGAGGDVVIPPERLPPLARLVVRLGLPGDDAGRALADLEQVQERVAELRGAAAAARQSVREACVIVLWSAVDRIRQVRESSPGAAGPERRRARMFGDLKQDLRFGGRALRRRPGFTFLTLVVLAVGIGAVTSILTIGNALFFAPPQGVREPDRMVRLFREYAPGQGGSLGYADFLEYRSGARSLSGLAAYSSGLVTVTAGVGNGRTSADVRVVSDGYFEVLGLDPARGRFFRPEENRTPGTHPVMVVSWGFWQERLGGAPDVVGRDVALNGRRFTVVGVAPRDFRGLSPAESPADVYIPILMRDAIAPSTDAAWRERLPNSFERWLTVVGRLRADGRIETARAELQAVSARIRATYPTEPQEETVLVTDRFRWSTSGDQSLRELTRLLLAAVLVVLAVATANVAILLLARASARSREIGVRAAIGAGRGRIVRQLLTESLLLALAGGALGVMLSLWMTRVTAGLLPIRLEPAPVPDVRVLAAALAVTILTGLLVSAVPAARATRRDVLGAIVGRGRGSPGGRLRDSLVVVQIALSLVLVTGAALFTRSLAAARSLDLGFEPDNVLAVQINLRNHGYDADRGRAFIGEALARLSAVPGVVRATTTRQLPFRGEWTSDLDPPPGVTLAPDQQRIENVGRNTVSAGYFEVMDIPIVAGRPIQAADHAGATSVAVVNETFARTVFPAGNALGQAVPLSERGPFTIVGIARDAVYYELGEAPRMQVYSAALQFYQSTVTFVLKTAGPPLDVARPVQDALHELDPNLAFLDVQPLAAIAAEQLAPFRASAHVVALSGLIALLMACAGLYGVMTYRVAERTREIGVRIALGATRPGIAGSVLRRGMRLAVIGVAAGLLGALALGRVVAGLLFAVQPRDTLSLIAAPAVLLAVAAAALVVPVRRAMAIDPVRAMRVD
jgi:predicted permease